MSACVFFRFRSEAVGTWPLLTFRYHIHEAAVGKGVDDGPVDRRSWPISEVAGTQEQKGTEAVSGRRRAALLLVAVALAKSMEFA